MVRVFIKSRGFKKTYFEPVCFNGGYTSKFQHGGNEESGTSSGHAMKDPLGAITDISA